MKRKIINFIEGGEKKKLPHDLNQKEGGELVYDLLMGSEPCMVARFGKTELETIIKCLAQRRLGGLGSFLLKKTMGREILDQDSVKKIGVLSGFFPYTKEKVNDFTDLMIEAIPQLDVLGSWVDGENILLKYFPNAKVVSLRTLEPYYEAEPWSRALAGKKVLVIHPFAETIEEQYKKHNLLFENSDMLPSFELKTIKAVQSLAGTEVAFTDWFEALNHMKKQIDNIDFDIAIIGCGAYGFPLAAYVKEIGKKAVHMGGSVQILFGIKGKRWDDHEIISKLYNKEWVRPKAEETPQNAVEVEDACYW